MGGQADTCYIITKVCCCNRPESNMPPKKEPAKGGKAAAPKKPKDGAGGGKAKKKKWSKGKVRDKLNNLVLFDKATYDKLYDEVPTYKLITPSVVSERLKVRGSLARRGLIELANKGLINQVVAHSRQVIYTRTIKGKDEDTVEAPAKGKKGKSEEKEPAAAAGDDW